MKHKKTDEDGLSDTEINEDITPLEVNGSYLTGKILLCEEKQSYQNYSLHAMKLLLCNMIILVALPW